MGPGGEKVLTICARRCKKGVGSCEEVNIWKCGTGREVGLVDVSQHLRVSALRRLKSPRLE